MKNQIKDNWSQALFSMLSIVFLIVLLPWRAMAADMDCPSLEAAQSYDLNDGPSEKKSLLVVYEAGSGSQNYPIFIYLETDNKCRLVLSTWGRGIDFEENENSGYPVVEVYWHHGAGENPPVAHYVWVKNKYVDTEMSKSNALNEQALKLFRQGNIHKAIRLWKQSVALAIIPGLGHTSNAEALNNLGFAYYRLAVRSQSNDHFKLASTYLEQSIEVDPERWIAYLNLGDLYADWDWPEGTIQNYETLLKMNPNYKNAAKIKEKLEILKSKIKAK